MAEKKDPWCVYTGFIGPHDPYFAPSTYLDRFPIERVPLPTSYTDQMRDKPQIYQRMRDQIYGQLSEREIREAIRHYWVYTAYVDDLFGKILDKLTALNQTHNTVVLFCSDHGDYAGDHGLFSKGIPVLTGLIMCPF